MFSLTSYLAFLAFLTPTLAAAMPQATTSTKITTTSTKAATTSTKATTTASATTTAAASGNPFSGKQMYANAYYSSEVVNLAIPALPSSLKAAASQVAKVPSFYWMDTHSKVPM